MKMLKKILIAGALTPSVGRNSGKWPGSRVWNLRLTLGKTMQGAELREMEWAPPKEAPPLYVKVEPGPLDQGPARKCLACKNCRGKPCTSPRRDRPRKIVLPLAVFLGHIDN
jgi:hypothetical protein